MRRIWERTGVSVGDCILIGEDNPMDTLDFTCSAIDSKGGFLREYTGRGEDISPEFAINDLSPNAKTLLVTLEDMSHPIKRFTHWVIWNIPAANVIPKGIPHGKHTINGAVQGMGYGLHRYAGPKPPHGKTHKYHFAVYALDCELDLKPFSFKKRVLSAARWHIIQRGEVCGYFEGYGLREK